jgi:gas vesicle protein
MHFNNILMELSNIDFISEQCQLNVIEDTVNAYQRAYLLLDNCDDEKDVTSFSLFQESDNSNSNSKSGILQRLWKAILELFGIVEKKAQKVSSEQAVQKTTKTVEKMEEIVLNDPELNDMTSQVINGSSDMSDQQMYAMFSDFSKKRDRNKMAANIAGKVLGTAAIAGGIYGAHKLGVGEKIKNFAYDKYNEKKQKIVDDAVSKTKDMFDAGMEKTKEFVENINEATQEEISNLKSDISKLSDQVKLNAKKFISAVFQSMSFLSGTVPPNIDIDEIVNNVSYDAEGKLHIPINFDLVNGYIRKFRATCSFNPSMIEEDIKSGNVEGISIEEFIAYYSIKCYEILYEADFVQQEFDLIEFDDSEIIQEAFGKNKKEEADHDAIKSYVKTLRQKLKENGYNMTSGEASELANKIKESGITDPHQFKSVLDKRYTDVLKGKQKPKSEEKSTKDSNKEQPKKTEEKKDTTPKEEKHISSKDKNENKHLPKKVETSSEKKPEEKKSSANDLPEKRKEQFPSKSKPSSSNEPQSLVGKTGKALITGAKNIGNTALNVLKNNESTTALANTIENVGGKIEQVKKKIQTKLDLSYFATAYRAHIFRFHKELVSTYENESAAIDFPITLDQYISFRENMTRDIIYIQKAINGDSKENKIGMAKVLYELNVKDATMKSSLLNDNIRKDLENLQKYLKWDGDFFNSILDLFNSIDDYLNGIEGVAEKMDSILKRFNENSKL